jgi:hypothetical protein
MPRVAGHQPFGDRPCIGLDQAARAIATERRQHLDGQVANREGRQTPDLGARCVELGVLVGLAAEQR